MNYQEYVEAVQKRAALIKDMKRKDITVGQLDDWKAVKASLEKEMRKFIWTWACHMRSFICNNPDLFDGETFRIMDSHYNINKQPLLKVRKDGGLALRMEQDCGEYREMGNVIVVPKDFILDREAYIRRRKVFMAYKKIEQREKHIILLQEKQKQVRTQIGLEQTQLAAAKLQLQELIND
ncbi:hypothetical protein FDJ20_gp131 [Vibrio phage Thalassa]|uniref:Uncharacterized protein n=1 Tax=Vibrio phage Thalassa TaxID=2570301 RepID=A0A2H5BH86_9CAUD|nr:hypothetical protein FDJ20_gp131 [Vibrio phage Thalassa]AUG85371.1 hypothetical protein THALASSA_192 [Vibrio phage Thalassa]